MDIVWILVQLQLIIHGPTAHVFNVHLIVYHVVQTHHVRNVQLIIHFIMEIVCMDAPMVHLLSIITMGFNVGNVQLDARLVLLGINVLVV